MAHYVRGQSQSQVVSDGNSTIGYVAGKPAEWDGNSKDLQNGDYYILKDEDSTFGVNTQDEYRVVNGAWVYAEGKVLQ